jgi:hypothetical protein
MTKAERDKLSPYLGAVWAQAFMVTFQKQIDNMHARSTDLEAHFKKHERAIFERSIECADILVAGLEVMEEEMERYT